MNHSISDGSYGYFSFFIVSDRELSIPFVFICAIIQYFAKSMQFFIEVILKIIKVVRGLFAFSVDKP